jgi:hypothetical protein
MGVQVAIEGLVAKLTRLESEEYPPATILPLVSTSIVNIFVSPEDPPNKYGNFLLRQVC